MWSFSRPSQVTCLDCGFLTMSLLRHHALGATSDSSEAPTVGLANRARIRDREATGRAAVRYVCFVEATDYQAGCNRSTTLNDYGEIPDDPDAERCILDHIADPRHCPAFYRFQPGRTPKEHLDVRDAERQRKEHRQWEWSKTWRSVVLASATTVLVLFVRAWLESVGILPKLPGP
jgi:hypothetical protein